MKKITIQTTLERVALTLLVMMLTTFSAWASTVYYKNASGTVTEVNATLVDDNMTTLGTSGQTTWYYISTTGFSTTYYSNRISIQGTVNLILTDGCDLSFENGIRLTAGNTLNIFVGNKWNSTVEGTGRIHPASIGGNDGADSIDPEVNGGNGENAGTLNIYDGEINVAGNVGGGKGGNGCENDYDSRGGNGGDGGTIHFYGGKFYVNESICGGNPGYGEYDGTQGSPATVTLSWTNSTDEVRAWSFYNSNVTLQKAFKDYNKNNYPAGSYPNGEGANDLQIGGGVTLCSTNKVFYYQVMPEDNTDLHYYNCYEANAEKYQEGETVTLTEINGYRMDITVTDGTNNIPVARNGRIWSFTMPAHDVWINGTATLWYLINVPDGFTIGIDDAANCIEQDYGWIYYKPGATVTLGHTNREGYEFLDYTVTKDGTAPAETVDVTENTGVYTFTMPASNVTITAVWEPLNQISLTASLIESLYWTTFYCGDAGYRIDSGENASAYTATFGDDVITLHKLGKMIPKEKAVIIVGEDNSISMSRDDVSAAEYSVNNDLQGVDVPTPLTTLTSNDAPTLYMLSNKNNHFGFHEYGGTNVPARKAYFTISANNARPFSMVFEDETTGINDHEYHELSGAWYTLDGRKLDDKPTEKGIYIVRSAEGRLQGKNGKKVAIK